MNALRKWDAWVAIILGILVLFNPFNTMDLIIRIIGVFLTVNYAVKLFTELKLKTKLKSRHLYLLALGIVFIAVPFAATNLVGWGIGGFLLLHAFNTFRTRQTLPAQFRDQVKTYAIVITVIGALFIIFPGVISFMISFLLSLALIVYGIVKLNTNKLVYVNFGGMGNLFQGFDGSASDKPKQHDPNIIDVDVKEK